MVRCLQEHAVVVKSVCMSRQEWSRVSAGKGSTSRELLWKVCRSRWDWLGTPAGVHGIGEACLQGWVVLDKSVCGSG